jgi:hypothetical protein
MATCIECQKQYSGNLGHCVVCHETFSTQDVSDLHWNDQDEHFHPSTLPKKLHQDSMGIWRRGSSARTFPSHLHA